jgi:hypothetical protein
MHNLKLIIINARFLHSQLIPSLCYFRDGARTDEEDTPISCGRFFLTYYFLHSIFDSSYSKFLLSAYDAMSSQRLYHYALPPDRITSELETNRATQFPPEAVDAFQGMVKHKATD